MMKLSLTITFLIFAAQSSMASVTIPMDRLNQFKKSCSYSVKHNSPAVKDADKACDCMAQQLSVYADRAKDKAEVRKTVDYAIRFFQPAKQKQNEDLDAILADWGDHCVAVANGTPEASRDEGTPPSDDK